MTTWTVQRVPHDGAIATALVRRYLTDIIGRYYGRPATEAEVDLAIAEDPTDDLVGFFVASWGGTPRGCAGFRLARPGVVELKRLFVDPAVRGRGGGAVLLAEVERAAAALGATAVRLDTRHDLVEARALYARQGYREAPAFNDARYAEHWFEKRL
ncbi:GNAT family N-acetyltransferase [Saccharothrix coeruleofusca]|uniref:GNAT family N-acetyltransferase n=1 Tax=Saccharothrix coeruleofusca TaxID=33919 RepID=UPI001670C13D|nr:GNAT family N-acetyltransferase [Saccharothrix coeruleofusca]